MPCLIIFHIIPTILIENLLLGHNLYSCDFSIWPETFLQGKFDYDFKGVEWIFPFHGVFLVCISGIVGKLIWFLTSKKLRMYGDPYDRITAIIENKVENVEEL